MVRARLTLVLTEVSAFAKSAPAPRESTDYVLKQWMRMRFDVSEDVVLYSMSGSGVRPLVDIAAGFCYFAFFF